MTVNDNISRKYHQKANERTILVKENEILGKLMVRNFSLVGFFDICRDLQDISCEQQQRRVFKQNRVTDEVVHPYLKCK